MKPSISLLAGLVAGMPLIASADPASGIRLNLGSQALTAPSSYLFIPTELNDRPGTQGESNEAAFQSFTYISRYYWRLMDNESSNRVQFVCDIKLRCNKFESLDDRMAYVDEHYQTLNKAVQKLPSQALVRISCPISISAYSEEQGGFPIETCINDKTQTGDQTSYGAALFENPYDRMAGIKLYPGIDATDRDEQLVQTVRDNQRVRQIDSRIRRKARDGAAAGTAIIYGHLVGATPMDRTDGSYRVVSMAVDGYTVSLAGESGPFTTFALTVNPIVSAGEDPSATPEGTAQEEEEAIEPRNQRPVSSGNESTSDPTEPRPEPTSEAETDDAEQGVPSDDDPEREPGDGLTMKA